jgi:hypothetical protein
MILKLKNKNINGTVFYPDKIISVLSHKMSNLTHDVFSAVEEHIH